MHKSHETQKNLKPSINEARVGVVGKKSETCWIDKDDARGAGF